MPTRAVTAYNPYRKRYYAFGGYARNRAAQRIQGYARRYIHRRIARRVRLRNVPPPIPRSNRLVARKRTGFGYKPGKSTARKIEVHPGIQTGLPEAFDTRTLYGHNYSGQGEDLLQIPEEVNGFDDRYRERKVIKISGIHFCFQFRNDLETPVYFHYAIMNEKACLPQTNFNADFFRDHGKADQRNTDFVNPNSGLTALELHCLPINTDKWNVLTHKKYRVGPKDPNLPVGQGAYNFMGKNNYFDREFYLPLNRQIRFDGSGSAAKNTDPLYLVHWCDQIDSSKTATAVTHAYNLRKKIVVFWRAAR